MSRRLNLHLLLKQITGTNNVYFQPPPSVCMSYPAIVYSRNNIDNRTADNSQYTLQVQYTVTVIDPNPDSELVMKIAKLPMCTFSRHYASDNLNHDVFTLYY